METKNSKKSYRVAYCDKIFPTLAAAKHYVYINFNPQDNPEMNDTYITGYSAVGEPVTFTHVVSSRFVFRFEKTFSN